MEKRKQQIADMQAELRLTKSKARRRDLLGMIREARRLLKLGR